MGIRFRCPDGHKIHVKSFLAGKRGICPVCGRKVPIPRESDPEFADRPARKRQTSPRTAAPPNSASRSAAQPAAAVPDMTADAPGTSSPSTPQILTEGPAELAGSVAGDPSAVTAAPADRISAEDSPVSDPISIAPDARWFVRPPSGGQFGPAPGSLLREWMAEGRVTPDTYVWREGWPEWQRARAVFGDFHVPATSTTPPLPAVTTASKALSTSQLYRQRKSTKSTLVVVSLLGLACALLFAALVYVVRFMD